MTHSSKQDESQIPLELMLKLLCGMFGMLALTLFATSVFSPSSTDGPSNSTSMAAESKRKLGPSKSDRATLTAEEIRSRALAADQRLRDKYRRKKSLARSDDRWLDDPESELRDQREQLANAAKALNAGRAAEGSVQAGLLDQLRDLERK